MRTETYKGIEFVRITDMPQDQQARIFETLDQTRIIKILRDRELIEGCVLIEDYNQWLKSWPIQSLQ